MCLTQENSAKNSAAEFDAAADTQPSAGVLEASDADALEISNAGEKNRLEPKTLYLVATPIGNLSDISERAVKILTECDFIAAEDTRVTSKLLSRLGLNRPMVPYHDHNMRECGVKLIERLAAGDNCALVTDAGMPGVSDPGEELVKLCVKSNVNVTCVPGPCAAMTALVLSGFDTSRFSFEGFISDDGRTSKQRDRLQSIKNDTRTLIFYEAPHRLRQSLDMYREIFGERRLALCRELTKINEEIWRGTLDGAIELYKSKEPRGEYVVVIAGADAADRFWSEMTLREHAEYYMNNLGMSKNDACKAAARDRGIGKSEVYREFI